MPPTVTIGAAAPAGSTVTIAGEDLLGQITFVSGSTGAGTGILFEVKFGNAHSEAPGKVTLMEVSGALPLPGTVNITAGIWQFDGVVPPAGTYVFVYSIQ